MKPAACPTVLDVPKHTRVSPAGDAADMTLEAAPGPTDRTVTHPDGRILSVPATWQRLPPGDAGLTRRVKASGPYWVVKERRGRRTFSLGVWADADRIAAARDSIDADRSTDAYQARKVADKQRRDRKQSDYEVEFQQSVLDFLQFHQRHAALADRLADAVTRHAVPVGSGTVARTQRIPVSQRAQAAVIAWLRHQTTGYDDMVIPPVKGQRREVRRRLAEASRRLLQRYRIDQAVDAAACPIAVALAGRPDASAGASPGASPESA